MCTGSKRPREARTWQESWTQRHTPRVFASLSHLIRPSSGILPQEKGVLRLHSPLRPPLGTITNHCACAGAGPPRPREAGPESAAEVGRKLALCSPIGKRNRELRAHEIPNHISCSEIPPAGGFIGVGAENHVTPKGKYSHVFFPCTEEDRCTALYLH